mmetsp:Transcript_112305/g.322854  ORF Transcript_112305/g.322854 Transcript_112305/m.322854 type:complete len:209 (-) Transcript_112305:876-1502(-)
MTAIYNAGQGATSGSLAPERLASYIRAWACGLRASRIRKRARKAVTPVRRGSILREHPRGPCHKSSSCGSSCGSGTNDRVRSWRRAERIGLPPAPRDVGLATSVGRMSPWTSLVRHLALEFLAPHRFSNTSALASSNGFGGSHTSAAGCRGISRGPPGEACCRGVPREASGEAWWHFRAVSTSKLSRNRRFSWRRASTASRARSHSRR